MDRQSDSLTNVLRRYELLAEQTREVALFIGADGAILDANQAALEAYGYSREEMLSLNITDLSHSAAAAGPHETMHRRKDGTRFPAEISFSRAADGIRLALVQDVTQRRQMEESQTLLLEIDRLILHRRPLSATLQRICSGLADVFGFPVVWIAEKDPAGVVNEKCVAGSHKDLMTNMAVRWDETPQGMGPTGLAIRTGEPQVFNVEDPNVVVWRAPLQAIGMESGLSLPLTAQGQTVGALSIYVQDRNAFDQEVIRLLDRFAGQAAIAMLEAKDQEEILLQKAALEAAANAMVITDVKGQVLWVNSAWTALTGYTVEESLGRNLRMLKSGRHTAGFYREMWETILAGRTWHGEVFNLRKDGTLYVEEMSITAVRNAEGAITHFIAVKQDITERKRQEERLHHLAMHDPLTDLANRRALRENMERVVSRSTRGHRSTLLLLDMDNFKQVNDTLGHSAGDQLLIAAAQGLRHTLRPFDVVARWGGDEFAVLLEDIALNEAVAVAERLRQMVMSLPTGSPDIEISVSIGVAPIDGTLDSEGVTALADFALYTAKEEGRNRVVVSQSRREDIRLSEASQWAGRLRAAVREDRLTLFFQPIVRLDDETVTHHEVLVRLADEEGKVVPAAVFIPAAERLGLMPLIDRWVVGGVVRALKADPALRVFVNLSGQSLGDDGLLDFIEQAVRSGDFADRLGFEITETALVRDLASVQVWMWRLKSLGCRFALDDFGTGFTSFTYLRSLPVDYVKIDQSFIQNLATDSVNSSLVMAMRTMVQALGKETVAEGIESSVVLDLLRGLKVEYGQGFHWGRPGPEAKPVQGRGASDNSIENANTHGAADD